MSSEAVAELRRQVEVEKASRLEAEASQRAAEASQRAAEASQRAAEAGRLEAEASQRAAEAGRRAAERETRSTTFDEYLTSLHDASKYVSVQHNKSLTTKGSVTNPSRKICPTLLRRWEGFPKLQQDFFDKVHHIFHPDPDPSSDLSPRLFSSTNAIADRGRELSERKIASERDLEYVLRSILETPVAGIISKLVQIPAASSEFDLAGEVIFENHANTISEANEEVRASLAQVWLSGSEKVVLPTHADQICVHQNVSGRRELRFIVEYKAPHKLTVEHLRRGLRHMDLPLEVVNRAIMPADPEGKLQRESDWRTAAAVSQTFGYMIENGLEFSYISTGETMVFLRVAEDNPETVYFHLAEPQHDSDTTKGRLQLSKTAIGQMLSFCLIALQSRPRSMEWRRAAYDKQSTWTVDFDAVCRQMSKDNTPSPRDSTFKGVRCDFRRSPYALRKKRPRSRSRQVSCATDVARRRNRLSDTSTGEGSEDDEDGGGNNKDVSRCESDQGPVKPVRRSTPCKTSSDQRQNQMYSYCTQTCLLRLMQGGPLDKDCPNVADHRKGSTDRHAIRGSELPRLVRRQLAGDMDHYCQPLDKQGARGALFKITLVSHGYTFVAKGTIAVYIPHLNHEARMYHLMHELQGDTIPVYLGSFNLRDTYFLAFRVYIVHMMLMSWAGEAIDEATVDSAAVQYAVDAITRVGVKHGDLRAPNILWNSERQRVMVIDFERSKAMAKMTERAPPKTLVPLVGSEQATCPAICQSPWTSWLASPRGPTGHQPGSGTKSYQLDGEAGIPTLRGWSGRKYRKTVGAHENGRRRSASNIVCP